MRHGSRAAMARRVVFASPCNQCMCFSLAVGRFWQAGLPGMLNLEDGVFGTAGIQSGKVLWRRWTLELEVFCTGWTVFFESGDLAFLP